MNFQLNYLITLYTIGDEQGSQRLGTHNVQPTINNKKHLNTFFNRCESLVVGRWLFKVFRRIPNHPIKKRTHNI